METMNGWIKLSRGIRQNWVWNNPDWLKWWIDLLLLAAWEDTVVRKRRRKVLVKRGEVAMSERELQRRWGLKSSKAARNFLLLLADDGMITRHWRAPYVENEAEKQFSQQNCTQNKEQNRKQDRKQTGKQFFYIIRICNYDSFQSVVMGAGSTFRSGFSSIFDSGSGSSNGSDSSGTINKEYKNIRNTTTTTSACACACESEKKIEDEDFWKWLLAEENSLVLKKMSDALGIAFAEMRGLAGQIREEWGARAAAARMRGEEPKRHIDFDDAAQHFMSHVRKELERRAKRKALAPGAAAAPRETARERARRELDEGVAAAMEQAQRAMAAREADELEERWSRLEAGHDYTEYEDVESD